MMPPPPTRRSASEPDITLDKPDEIPPDPRRYLLFCGDENRCMLKALLRVNDVCYDRPQGWTALGNAHDAISGDMLHAQEKSFQRGVSHGKWLLKACCGLFNCLGLALLWRRLVIRLFNVGFHLNWCLGNGLFTLLWIVAI